MAQTVEEAIKNARIRGLDGRENKTGVVNGTRTRDLLGHNQAL